MAAASRNWWRANWPGGWAALPAWLSVSHASIERISKKVVREDGRIDGVSEEFIPPILTRRELADTQLVLHTDYFELVDDVNRYYYRKLYLNNIGHAVLAYLAQKRLFHHAGSGGK